MIACRRYSHGPIDWEFHCRVWITKQPCELYNPGTRIFPVRFVIRRRPEVEIRNGMCRGDTKYAAVTRCRI